MDEEEGLDTLIAQRSQRSSFARMISWEFNDGDKTKVVPAKRRQRQTSKQQSGETTQHIGDDDLEACGQDDLDPAMRSDMSSWSLEGFSDSDDEFFSAEDFCICDSEPCTGDSVVSVSIEGQEETKCIRNTGEECESGDQTSVNKTLDISKDVPSLVQLCIKSAYKINLKSLPELPNKFKSHFCIDEDFLLQKLQLSWLHSALSQFEPNEKFVENCMSKDIEDKPAELLHPARNVWNQNYGLICAPKDYRCSEVLATLPFMNLDLLRENGYGRAVVTWAVVAATVKLMMPPFLSADAFRHQSESENDCIVRATRNVMTRLKYALKNRFPTVVSHCFDDVVPYALWARGDINQAAEYFMSLSQNTTKENLKGLYLNEVGRMHAQIGAMETAAKFYRLASDAVLMDGKNSVHTDEVATQMLMLVANIYDQGVLTPQKGRQSVQAWNVVKANRYSHKADGLEQHIADTYFCTHCGSVQGREWLEKAKPMLNDLTTFDPKLLYYLSMVHALLGEETQAHTVYWDYVKSMGKDFMASEMVSLSGQGARCNPWIPLVTMVKEVDTNVQFLPVVWRMQLQHLKVCSGSGLESDICSKTLDLHFDSSGCLTGNMQMLLPPIRRVRLNPYTGALQFDQCNSPTKVLTAWDRNGGNLSIHTVGRVGVRGMSHSAHPQKYRLVITDITVLGSVLTFCIQQYSTCAHNLWIVDLESKDAFLASKYPIHNSYMIKLPIRNQVCHTIPGADLLLSQRSIGFSVRNIKKGKEPTTEVVECLSTNTSSCADISRMFVFGSQLLGLSFNSRIWRWSTEKSHREVEGDEFAGARDLDLIGNVLVVSTDRGIKFSPVPADCDQELYSLPVVLSAEFKGTPLNLNKEGTMICKRRERIKVTGTQEEMTNGKKVYRAAISLDNIAVVMLVPSDLNGPKSLTTIEILMAVTLPGYGTETCFISQQGGVLFGWTHYKEKSEDYREHVFQVDYDARLRGVVPFLGYGPRSFLPVYLPGDSDIQTKHPGHGQAGWYVFMRDGHEGIIGIKLFC